MPTYSEIPKFVQRHHGFVPKTGWIAHVKALGLPTRRAANRVGLCRRVAPYPSEKREAIEEALRHLMVPLTEVRGRDGEGLGTTPEIMRRPAREAEGAGSVSRTRGRS